jgi:putative ATP-dependent endonuclease of the OLD family
VFGDYSCLVGPGGAGKSTVLNALRVFFRDTTGSPTDLLILHEEDFHKRDTTRDVRITLTFSDGW